MEVKRSAFLKSVLVCLSVLAIAPKCLIGDENPFAETKQKSIASDPFGEEPDSPGGAESDPFGEDEGGEACDDDIFLDDPFGASQEMPQGGTIQQRHEERLRRMGIYSIDPISAKQLAILNALRQPVSFAFDGDTLADVVAFVKDECSFPILFDRVALAEEGKDPTSDVVESFSVDSLQLRSALALILKEHEMVFEVREGFVFITTQSAADSHMVTRIYRPGSTWRATGNQIAQAIETAVTPASWESSGGPGSICLVEDGFVVSNSYGVHEKIDQLFTKLDALYATKRRTR